MVVIPQCLLMYVPQVCSIVECSLQVTSWLSFLGPFTWKTWALIALTTSVCGLLYGIVSFVVKRMLPSMKRVDHMPMFEEIKIAGLFTFGACVGQGTVLLCSLCNLTLRSTSSQHLGLCPHASWDPTAAEFIVYEILL